MLDPRMDPTPGPYAQPPTQSATTYLSDRLSPPSQTPGVNPDLGAVIYAGNPYTPAQTAAIGSHIPPSATVNPAEDDVEYYNDLMAEFAGLDMEKKRKWALWLALGGYLPGGVADVANADDQAANALLRDVDKGYDNLLVQAALMYQNGIKITPEELLRNEISFRLGAAGVDWDGKLNKLSSESLTKLLESATGATQEESLAGTFTSTSKYLDFMDPMDAKAMARGVLQQELGRDPTNAEYQDFISAIHAAERRDPTTTRTTVTTDEEGRVVSQNSVTNQGMTAAGLDQLATEKARRNPDWAEWQAMGTYAPALFAALGATVPGV